MVAAYRAVVGNSRLVDRVAVDMAVAAVGTGAVDRVVVAEAAVFGKGADRVGVGMVVVA